MHAFSFSIYHLLPRSLHKNQKRAALQLLALSGVVRPGHVELRFPITRINRPTVHAQRVTSHHLLIQSFPMRAWERTITFHLKQIWQWVSSLGMQSKGHEAKRSEVTEVPAV